MNMGPVPFEDHDSGSFLHGTRADLRVGDLIAPGHRSNYNDDHTSNHVYITKTLDAAAWGAELATGGGRERVYFVEATGAVEDDPNVTDKRFPGNPTKSYRTRLPVRVTGELVDWVGHSPDQVRAMRQSLEALRRDGLDIIYD